MELLRGAVEAERARSGSLKASIGAVARAMGLTPRRVQSVWWGQPVRIDWQEAERIFAALEKMRHQEIAHIEARLAALHAMHPGNQA